MELNIVEKKSFTLVYSFPTSWGGGGVKAPPVNSVRGVCALESSSFVNESRWENFSSCENLIDCLC